MLAAPAAADAAPALPLVPSSSEQGATVAMDADAAATPNATGEERKESEQTAADDAPSSLLPPSTSAAPPSLKRKLDKQSKRAASKALKKAKHAQRMQQQRLQGEEADDIDEGAPSSHSNSNPLGTSKRSGALSASSLLETVCFTRGGYRTPYPYWFEFSCYAKRRWLGKALLDVMQNEYGNGSTGLNECDSRSYYAEQIRSGAMRINGRCVAPDHVMREGDHVQHYMHRHETPVTADPLLLRYSDSRLIVLDKPSSLPVHPCGSFRHNSVLYALAAQEQELKQLFVVHRLDAVTSGLLLLAKDAAMARRLSMQIAEKSVRKEYVARVQGKMDSTVQNKVVRAAIYQHTEEGRTFLSTTPPPTPAHSSVTLLSPPSAATATAARPKCEQTPDAFKEAITVFSFLAYDEATDTSLVKCELGRWESTIVNAGAPYCGLQLSEFDCTCSLTDFCSALLCSLLVRLSPHRSHSSDPSASQVVRLSYRQ